MCRISLVVTRPLLVPALTGSVVCGLTCAWSSSRHVCLLALCAAVGPRFSDVSVAPVFWVFVVARGSGGPAGRTANRSGVSSRSVRNNLYIAIISITTSSSPQSSLSPNLDPGSISSVYSDSQNRIYCVF